MESKIQNFYNSKNIFVTGGSGFLGKVIIEKLLRSTEVNRIYVLIRPKHGQNIQERIAAWKAMPLFELVLKSNANALDRVMAIAGDCCAPDLGISNPDRALLVEKVHVVLHSAANVQFFEPLHLTLDTNTRGTYLMLQLAKQMFHLEAFVHVSSAFANCVIEHISERFYSENLTCSAMEVLALREKLSNDFIDRLTPSLLRNFPNTYTYTKALAEEVVRTEATTVPVCIFRPGNITVSCKEPVTGWIDNYYGPIPICLGIALGYLHIAIGNSKASNNMVPVDYCANTVLACAWHLAGQNIEQKLHPLIYNYVPINQNLTTWGEMRDNIAQLAKQNPSAKLMWYPWMQITQNHILFNIAAIFYHLLPGYIIDMALRHRGQKPRMIKLYKKAHRNINTLSWFSNNSWSFDTDNVERLWQLMSSQDQKLFSFDIMRLNWNKYFNSVYVGMMTYLLKDDSSDECKLRSKNRIIRFVVLRRILQFALCSGLAAILWSKL